MFKLVNDFIISKQVSSKMKDDMQGEVDQNNMTICFAKDIFSMLGMSLKLKT